MDINLDQLPKKSLSDIPYRNLWKETLLLNILNILRLVKLENSQWKQPNKCSIYTAEALVILKAIKLTINNLIARHVIIMPCLSDSLSSLISIQNQWKPTDIARKTQNAKMQKMENTFHSCGFPATAMLKAMNTLTSHQTGPLFQHTSKTSLFLLPRCKKN